MWASEYERINLMEISFSQTEKSEQGLYFCQQKRDGNWRDKAAISNWPSPWKHLSVSTLGGAGCGQQGRNGQLDKGPAHALSSTLGIFKALCVGQEWLRAGLLTPGLAAGCRDTSGGTGKQKPDLDDSRYFSFISLSNLTVSGRSHCCYWSNKRLAKLGQRSHT